MTTLVANSAFKPSKMIPATQNKKNNERFQKSINASPPGMKFLTESLSNHHKTLFQGSELAGACIFKHYF